MVLARPIKRVVIHGWLANSSGVWFLQKKKRAAEPEANGAAEPEQKKKKKKSATAGDASTVAETADTLAALAASDLPVQEETDGAEAVDPTEKKKKKKKQLAEDPGAAEGTCHNDDGEALHCPMSMLMGICMCCAEAKPKKKKKAERYFDGAEAAEAELPAADKPKV